jgi:two-component sensor histidine kinase
MTRPVVPAASPWYFPDCRRWVLLAGLGLALAALALCLLQALDDRRAAVWKAERQTRVVAATLASQIASDVALANALAGRAAALLAGTSWDELGTADTAAALRGWIDGSGRIDGIWLMDDATTPRIASGRTLSTAMLDSHVSVLAQQDRDEAVHIGPATDGGAGKALRIAVSRRVTGSDGKVVGMVLITVHPSPLEALVETAGDFPVVVQVDGADNTMLARYLLGGSREQAGASDPLPPAAEPVSVAARLGVRDLPFGISASVSQKDVDANWRGTGAFRSGVTIAILAPVFLLGAAALTRNRAEMAARAELQTLAEGSEQRISERTATIERLMGEVNHRAKNSLQMISALLRMHAQVAKHADVRTELIEARNRVMTIAHVHDRLYRSDQATRVKLDGLLEEVGDDLLPTLVTLDGAAIDLVVAAEPAELAVDDAVPLILIMNELVASAVKHAFPAGRGGRIWVELAVAEGRVAILSVDNDGCPVSEDEAGGSADLPMTLIRGLAGQIGGDLSHRVSDRGGTRFEVRFSLVREKGRKRA